MNTSEADSGLLAERFVKMLAARAYDEAVAEWTETLRSGPGEPAKLFRREEALHQWFLALTPNQQQDLLYLVERIVYSVVFRCCAFLDGVSGAPPLIEERPEEFGVYWLSYRGKDAWLQNNPERMVRLDGQGQGNEDLHDVFNGLLQERRADAPS